MKIDNQRADFEAWYDNYDPRTPQDPFDRWLARKAWDAAMQSPQVQALREALEAIAAWEPPQVLSKGEIVPMVIAIGSRGEQDYFRDIARAALAQNQGD